AAGRTTPIPQRTPAPADTTSDRAAAAAATADRFRSPLLSIISAWRWTNRSAAFLMKKGAPSSPAPDRLSIVLQDRLRLLRSPRPCSRGKPFRECNQAEPLLGVVDPEESQHQPQTFLIGRPSQLLHGEPLTDTGSGCCHQLSQS